MSLGPVVLRDKCDNKLYSNKIVQDTKIYVYMQAVFFSLLWSIDNLDTTLTWANISLIILYWQITPARNVHNPRCLEVSVYYYTQY